ncbi:cytochrome P450 [Apiospora arundinis]|uniref:Cytochrome P450 n=1 Tax=Apiospora arundinis TaxID=335852 RepID=A0ABR2HQ70_9PEZI
MHHLRDALLSPSPKGPPELTRLDSTALDQQDVRECIARGEFEEVRGAALYNRTWIIAESYCASGDGVDSLEGYLHSLWHIYYQLARHISHETTEHDRLVLDVVRIQGLGPLTRPVSGPYGIDIARTVQGTLWNDMPFLATDMTGFWIENCATMPGAQRLNLASFLAKLASARISQDKLCQVALVIFRSAFEERRDLCNPDEPDDAEDTHRRISSLSISHLLPAACVWIKEAGHNLIQLSDVYWNDCPSAIGQGGQIFIESEFGNRSPTGFTPWRWMYWLKRLHEIKEEAEKANEKHLEEYATDAIGFMANKAKERNSGILRAYQNGGDTLQRDPHLVCLKSDDTD